jgi:hypothetical protein
VQRVVERLHVGIDLFLHVAGQEAEPFARLHRRAAEDDLVDMAVDHLVHGHGDGEIGLAGARGPDAEGQFMAEEVAHVVGLRGGARLDRLLARPDLQRAGAEHLHLVAVARAGILGFHRPCGRRRRYPRARCSCPPQAGHRAPEPPRRPRPCIAEQRDLVASPQDMHGQRGVRSGRGCGRTLRRVRSASDCRGIQAAVRLAARTVSRRRRAAEW